MGLPLKGVSDAVGVEQGFIQRAGHTQPVDGQEFVARFREAGESLGALSFKKLAQLLLALLSRFDSFGLA